MFHKVVSSQKTPSLCFNVLIAILNFTWQFVTNAGGVRYRRELETGSLSGPCAMFVNLDMSPSVLLTSLVILWCDLNALCTWNCFRDVYFRNNAFTCNVWETAFYCQILFSVQIA